MPPPRALRPGRFFAAPTHPPRPASSGGAPSWRRSTLSRSTTIRRPASSRSYSTEPPFSSSSSSSSSTPASRAERVLARLPPYLQRYTRRLKDAPVSHVVAFLILHEITALAPLVGLFGLFHYAAGSALVPLDYMMDHYGEQVAGGVRRFESYFRRKGWFGFGPDDAVDGVVGAVESDGADGAAATVRERWTSADTKYRVVVEVGLAYAITKALLPVRIAASLWATPWFAGLLARARALRRPKP